MASNDKQDCLTGHNQCPCLYDTSMWGSILASVKEQLPSFDSDSSSSDEENGELFIFQRDEEDLIPDLTEELADDPDIQLLESVKNAGKNWYEEIKDSAVLQGKDSNRPLLISPAFGDKDENQTGIYFRITEENTKWQKGDNWDLFSSRSQALITGPQIEEFPTSAYKKDLTIGNLGTGNLALFEESDSTSIKAIRKERRKMIEKNILRKEVKELPLENLNYSHFTKSISYESTESGDVEEKMPAKREGLKLESTESEVVGKKMPAKYEGLKLRSLEIIEEWDLDEILQNLEAQKGQGECTRRATCWEVEPPSKGRENLVSNSQDKLMDQLVALCARQSKSLSSPYKKASDGLMEDQTRNRSSSCISHLIPEQSHDMANGTKLKGIMEPPTVFIDLRQPDPKKSVPLIMASGSEYRFQNQVEEFSSSDSSTESEEETPDMRFEKEPRETIAQRPRDQTGKSYLLQQLRAFQKTSQSCGIETKVITQDTQDTETFEDMAKAGIRKKQVITRERHQNTSVRPLASKYLPLLDQEAKNKGENKKGHRQDSRFRKIHCGGDGSSE
ncbi:dynein axonemal assembly factor 8 isoform X2 [Sminthopsis crassicaudata]|uniref:dynein axonemal assembly factor 8 isoform X2 n=1 Tax=Sminthopsis crassicaudata TaxID=9301 RepID=UPI003D69FBFF